MNNKLIRKKPNKLLTYRRNYFQTGGNTEKNTPEKNTPGQALTNLGISAAGQIGGAVLGGGYQTGVGNTVSGLSSLASQAIPGIGGAIASAGLGVAGGLINRMFGSKLNKENIAKVEGNINELNTFQSNASDFDTLASNWANAAAGMQFDNSYIGSDGWFSHKASDKAKELRSEVEAGKNWVQSSLTNNAMNIQNQQMSDLWRNSAAYGGELFSNGGGIHIQPSKRGTFTAVATKHGMGVQEFASKVLANKGNYSPAMVKKANFARNASKWHAFGGDLLTHGSNFDTGITFIGNGGTHEANPYEGVPMGTDKEGVPNLVEEGEVIFDDYVFSNRLKVPKAVRNKYKLRGKKPITFADAALQMAKESEERPNDPISQNGLETLLGELAYTQEGVRERKQERKTYSYGGNLFKDGGDGHTKVQHKIRQGARKDPLDFTGEFEYYDGDRGGYTWQDVIKGHYTSAGSPVYDPETNTTTYYYDPVKKAQPKKFRFYDYAEKYDKNSPYREYDSLDAAQAAGEDLSKFGAPKDGEEVTTYRGLKPSEKMPEFDNWMRYTPIAGSLTGLGMSLFSKPDESGAEAILAASRGAGTYQPVRFKPVGNYLTYNPFDLDFAVNQANAESAAARRALMNTAGGNRAQAMAGILAADNNALNQLGILRRGAAEDNLKQRQMVEDFNRATNRFNSEGFLKADAANQQALAQARDLSLKGTMAAEEIRQRARLAKENAIQANLSGLFTSLGNIGQENVARQQMKWMIDNGYAQGFGSDKRSNGGKIKRRKKGLTY